MKRTWTEYENGFYTVVWASMVVGCMVLGWTIFDVIHLIQHHP